MFFLNKFVCQFSISATLILFGSSLVAQNQVEGYDNSFVISDVTVVPMDSERVAERQTVVIVDGKIESIGPSASADVPKALPVVDGNGLYLMPGLADMHVHVLHQDDYTNYLAWGVTTVMHMGGTGLPGAEILEHRERIKIGKMQGPNIYTTDRVFDGVPRLSSNSIELTHAEAARKEVRNLKDRGFDFIKIYNNIAKPEFDAVVSEANKVGLSVIGHIPRKFDTLESLSGGQDAIAHTEELFFSYFGGPRYTDETMQKGYQADMSMLGPLVATLIKNNVAVMPDLSFTFTDLIMWDDLELIWNDSDYPFLHPATASMWEGGNINRRSNIENFVIREQWKYELMLELTRQFQSAGVLQVIGTDAAIPGLYPGKAAHRELTELVKAGLSNFDAISIGTKNAGEFVRRYLDEDVKVGQVIPGYRADLILIAGNPLEDVRNVRHISGVIVNGQYISKSELDIKRSDLKERYSFLRSMNPKVDEALDSDNAEFLLVRMLADFQDDAEYLSTIEARINAAGYAEASDDRLDRAREILRLNTTLFPHSANTWDSFAEITLYLGDREAALKLYKKALDADPGFQNAAEQIEKIRSDQDD